MKKYLFLFTIIITLNSFSQYKSNSSRFKLGVGAEYRLTPVNENTIKIEYVNFTSYDAFISGVPVNFNLHYLMNEDWEVGFKYHFRFDYLAEPTTDNYTVLEIKQVNKILIVDYSLFIQKNFKLKDNNFLNLEIGYNFMNNGAIIEKYLNNKREVINYKFYSLNSEIFYQYKFIHLGLGFYYAPNIFNNKTTIYELTMPYFSLYFDFLKF